MIVVGERLNSSRKSILTAFRDRTEDYILDQALRQEAAGAAFIDVNAAALMDAERETLRWLIPLLEHHLSLPLSIDTPNASAMAEALSITKRRPLLNSLTLERQRMEALLPLIREFKPQVIALCLDDDGLSMSSDRAVAIAGRAAEILTGAGLAPEDIFIDPLVRPVGVEPEMAGVFLDSIAKIKRAVPGVRTIAGISNVSFGMPLRPALNRTLLVLALQRGLEAAICDPLDVELRAAVHGAEALLGRDGAVRNYLKLARALSAKS